MVNVGKYTSPMGIRHGFCWAEKFHGENEISSSDTGTRQHPFHSTLRVRGVESGDPF